MKLLIDRADLLAGLNIVKNATNSRGSLPVLANVSLSTTAKKLDLIGTNLDLHIRTRVKADITDPGSCTVSAALLAGLCSSFSGPSVELVALKSELKINCGDAKYRLGTLPVDEFPPLPKAKEPVEFSLPQYLLRRLLSQTAFCQSTDEARHVLNGCFLSLNGKLTAAATNGHQVAVDEAPVEGKNPEASIIVPTKIVAELLRLLDPDEAEDDAKAPKVHVAIAQNLVQFELDDTIIIGKLIEGQFPQYQRIIPSITGGVPIGRTDLLNALKRVTLLTEHCDLEFKGQSLTIRSRATGKGAPGEAAETFLIPKTDPVTVAFNGGYLIEALEAVDDDQVEFCVAKDLPSLIRVPNKPWLCVTAAIINTEKAEPAKEPKQPAPKQTEMPAATAPATVAPEPAAK